MKLIKGIMTTTQVLGNGFAHSLEDLRQFSELINSSSYSKTIFVDHRTDQPPAGTIIKAYVDVFPSDPLFYALFFEAEIDEDRMGDRKGFSMAFWGKRFISIHPALKLPNYSTGNMDLQIGINPYVYSEEQTVKFLNDVQGLFTFPVFAGDYFEHDLAGLNCPAILLIFSAIVIGALQQVGARLADAIIDNVFEGKKPKATAIKIATKTSSNTDIRIHVPTDGDVKTVKESLNDAFNFLTKVDTKNSDKHIGVTYDSSGRREVHIIPGINVDEMG